MLPPPRPPVPHPHHLSSPAIAVGVVGGMFYVSDPLALLVRAALELDI